ncbi:MAG: ComF family protein [Kiritimatiellae bacterium]|nr:ComF family protein [Kiritimatiellia bacterium]
MRMRSLVQHVGQGPRLRWMASQMRELAFPRACAGCHRPLDREEGPVCWECVADLPRLSTPFCHHCGRPVAGQVDHRYVCSDCTRRPPAFTCARAPLYYRGIAQTLIGALKYHHAVWLVPGMVDHLEAAVTAWLPEERFTRIMPVPLHPARQRQRGFNQSELLAQALGRRLGVPVDTHTLIRVRETPSQTHLTASQRLTNVKGAFRVKDSPVPGGGSILLIDDVMTTGATIHECARTLRKDGADTVVALTLARSG